MISIVTYHVCNIFSMEIDRQIKIDGIILKKNSSGFPMHLGKSSILPSPRRPQISFSTSPGFLVPLSLTKLQLQELAVSSNMKNSFLI